MITSARLPPRTTGVLSDIRHFFIHRPEIPTLLRFETHERREEYSQRIMQRTGVIVDGYSVLNIHRIGVEAPVRYVFDQLMEWHEGASWWPVHLAAPELEDGGFERIRILLLGGMRWSIGDARGILGGGFGTLFRLKALKIQRSPEPLGVDNARYLLYECSGGYPIGIFILYVRSPIAGEGETEASQLFAAVGFNFYGRRDWPRLGLVSGLWEAVHNRVTANVLNRLKRVCEASFEEIQLSI